MTRAIESSISLADSLHRASRKAVLLSLALLIMVAPAISADPGDVSGRGQSQQQPASGHNSALDQRDAVRELEPGKPIERELAGSESHAYQLRLAAGQYVRVTIDQRGINVAVTINGADGRNLVETDIAPTGESESVSLVAETSTTYRLVVRATDKNARRGRYEIRIEELRVATEPDKSRVTAERLVAEAMLLHNQQTADSRRKAVEKLRQSLSVWRDAKDAGREANALYLLGYVYNTLDENQKALEVCNQGLPLAKAAGDRKTEAYLLDTIGSAYNALGDKKKSLEFFNQALPLRQASDRAGKVTTLNNIGMAYGWMGEWPRALGFFNQVLTILRELGERRREATVLNNICVIHTNLGEYKKAIDFCSQSLSIKRDLEDRSGEATALNSIGNAYSSLGEYQQALDCYTQSLAIRKALGEHDGEAVSLNNIGWVYGTLGEYETAIQNYNQALQVFRVLGDRYSEAHILSNIGANYANLKDYRKALDIHLQALPIHHAGGNREDEAITLNSIANCYANLGEKEKALDYYDQALKLHRAVGNPRQLATVLRNIGVFHRDSGEYQKALDYLNEALQLSENIGDKNGAAGALAEIARLERDRGNVVEARSRIESALAAIESLRINVKSQQLRTSFLASVRKYYEFEVDVLMRLHKQRPTEGFDAAALEASERGRARSLLELLKEARAEIRQGVAPLLLEHERQLRQAIADLAERQVRLLSGAHTEQQAAALAKEMDTLTDDYEQVQTQIRQTSPRYAALTQPAPLGLKQIQQQVLDDESLLLEYALGEDKSFLWAVTPTVIKSFELPKRADIEQIARRVYETLIARNQNIAHETPAQRTVRVNQADAEYEKASRELSQMLLEPVAAELKDKRLVIVSEGVLQYVPFAALPSPRSPGSVGRNPEFEPRLQTPDSSLRTSDSQLPLIAEHEIVSLPSASVLAVLRQETIGRKLPSKTVAVLADPVFTADDPRIAGTGRNRVTENSPVDDVKRSAAESGLADLVRLRFSRQEAESIARLAGDNMKLKALDFAASRAVATSPEIGQYRIVHFAAHGLINNQHPELSGVVLSLVDRQGRPQNGFLRLYDIYNLSLAADLVVLSACQTALGRDIKGEGIVGLTRGFMYAGAPRVVASLWRIDDRATAELMRRFYVGILGEKLPPAAALRAAQASMLKDNRWQAPYYWAAFTLQGEWK